MRLFLDSANLDDIKQCLERGIISGVTVNQALLAKEPKADFAGHVLEIFGSLNDKIHLSVPYIDGTSFAGLSHLSFALKVPVSWGGLKTIRKLSGEGYSVNATCVFSVQQADMAVAAGASIVSVFVGRANDAKPPDGGYNTLRMIKDRHPDVTVLAGSVRNLQMVSKVESCGADIATISRTLLEEMANEIHSTQSAEAFDEAFAEWQK